MPITRSLSKCAGRLDKHGDLRAGNCPQPGLERALAVAALEAADILHDAKDRLLHDVLRLLMREAALERHIVNQPPIRLEKLLPTFLILKIFDPGQQARARGLINVLLLHNWWKTDSANLVNAKQ